MVSFLIYRISIKVDDKIMERSSLTIAEKNRIKIMRAAEIEFVKHGFQGTRMQAIADAAELPKANVHYYFKSKHNLYVGILRDIVEQWNRGLPEMDEKSDPAVVLSQFIRNKLTQSFAHKNRTKLFALEMIQGAPNLDAATFKEMQNWMAQKTQIIQSWIDAGKIELTSPTKLLFLIWASTQYYAEYDTEIQGIKDKNTNTEQEFETTCDFLQSFILKGCGLSLPQTEK